MTIGRRIPRAMGHLAAGVGGVFEPIAEDAVDRSLAGPLPEALTRSLIEHRVVERVVGELFASPEFRASLIAAIQHQHTEEMLGEVLSSEGMERLLTETLSSPAVQAALARQPVTYGERALESLRQALGRADDAVDRLLHRHRRPPWAGICTRAVGLVVDALLAQLLFLSIAGTIALIAALTVGDQHSWLAGAVGGIVWVVLQAAYFGGSWSTIGATPGMALVGVRVVDHSGATPGVARSLVRLVGLWLSIALLGLGFVPVLVDPRRRALQDFLAGTEVVRPTG